MLSGSLDPLCVGLSWQAKLPHAEGLATLTIKVTPLFGNCVFKSPKSKNFPLRGRLNAKAFRRGELACMHAEARHLGAFFIENSPREKSKKFSKGLSPVRVCHSKSKCVKSVCT